MNKIDFLLNEIFSFIILSDISNRLRIINISDVSYSLSDISNRLIISDISNILIIRYISNGLIISNISYSLL